MSTPTPTPLAPPAPPATPPAPAAPSGPSEPSDPQSAPADVVAGLKRDLAALQSEIAGLTRALSARPGAGAPAPGAAPPGAMSPTLAAPATPLPRSGDRASVLAYLRARRAD